MKPYVWQDGISSEEAKNGAYWERNMLALMLAKLTNEKMTVWENSYRSGWYYHGEWDGWSRVISINRGQITFHVPDDFDLGNLPQITPNWDGHTTEEKWRRVAEICGVILD